MTEIQALAHAYNQLEKYGEAPDQEYMAILKDLADDNTDKITEFTETWKSIFPSQDVLAKHGAGDKRLIEHDRIESAMKAFFKAFTKKTRLRCSFKEKCDLITEATAWYINDFMTGKSEWKYIKKAHYFISKERDGSELARIIIALKNRPKKDAKIVDLNYRIG